jgi:hypothetical protein
VRKGGGRWKPNAFAYYAIRSDALSRLANPVAYACMIFYHTAETGDRLDADDGQVTVKDVEVSLVENEHDLSAAEN